MPAWSNLVILGKLLTQNDQTCSGAAMFVVISAGPQKVPSRLDGTQNFASRADGRLGFEGKVPKVREGCLRQPARVRTTASGWTRFYTIFMSEPLMPEACLGKNKRPGAYGRMRPRPFIFVTRTLYDLALGPCFGSV